ncbi:MAG: MutS2 protein [Gemmatimonadetes bacterium]|nr:MutS2 protein [Gemmatimonadota bacterium]
MNSHALAVLEFPRVLALVAERATSSPGAQRVRSLQPRSELPWLEQEHARVAAVRAIITGDSPWHPEPVPDLSAPLVRLRVPGTSWSGEELLNGGVLLRSSRRTRDALRDEKKPLVVRAVLAPFAARLIAAKDAEDSIERAISEEGLVKDDASSALRRIRRELRSSQGELIALLERIVGRLESHHRVNDASVTVRNGRYVIPVRRDGRASVGGIVHDSSASGATLFVEPPAAVEFGNRIRELESDEHEEVQRILLELTERLRPLREQLLEALDVLAELDSLYARARFARDFACASPPMSSARDGFRIDSGRHPLLLAQGRDVVSFDLEMFAAERTLLVSGPNTGGKTVLLKAVGLMSALVQAGIPSPVGPESRLAIFDDFYADVGDEQSIEASLSTFSAHLKNLAEILRLSTADSLVLIDELGSGTDPQEGAALGWAILEELSARGTTTIATTHLGTLKELASQVPEVINASLQFDAVALAPTYKLIKGIPGRSYGISIARRLDLPAHIVARAEERMPQQERDMAALIEQLERKEGELVEREAEAERILADARDRIATLARRETNVRERERTVEKQSRQEARRYLLDARQEIERTVRGLQKASGDAVDEAAREARRKVEELAAKQGAVLDRLDAEETKAERRAATGSRPAAARPPGRPELGDWVDVTTLGGKLGRVIEMRGKEAVVTVGSLKLTVPLKSLNRRDHTPEPAVAWSGEIPDVHVQTEIDVRGLRADEVEQEVMQSLDSAIRADLKSLRIIHGKGTGALRARVTEMLQKESRVKAFRIGAWNEGGAGVTVVEL